MPVYKLNGQTYDIPDNVVANFEKDNPSATVAYQVGKDTYDIPVKERKGFLSQFPDAVLEGQQPNNQAKISQTTEQPQQNLAVASQPSQPQSMQMPQGFGQLDLQQAQQMGAGKGPVSWEQPEMPDHQETAVEKQQRMLQGNATPQEQKQVQKRMQQRQDEIAYEQETGKRLRQPVLNPEWEAPTIQRDDYGNIRHDENGNVIQGFTTDQSAVETHKDIVNRQTLGDKLQEAYAERMELQRQLSELSKKESANRKGPRFPSMVGGPAETYTMSEDSKNLSSALRLLERRIDALETMRDNGGFWGGAGDVLTDPSSYSFGLTDLADAGVMSSLKSKIEEANKNGVEPNLTDSEKALVRNYMANEEAEQLNAENWWYNAGRGFGQTLSFMKDFALTGGGFANIAKAGMNLGAKGGAKLATKALGDYMTKNLGTKALGKTIEYAGKTAGLVAGAEAGGFLLNNTVQAASSLSDIMNKQTGNLTLDKDGQLTFEGGKSLGEAVLSSQLARTGENGSELVGLAFDAIPGILGKVIQRTTAGKMIKKLTDSKFWKKGENALDYLGVQSVWGEGMEEEYNMARTEILNQLTGGEFAPQGSGLFDLEQQIDTWKTVGLTSMILRVPSMIASGTQAANYYGNKYNLNASDKQMRSTFGDVARYEAVKTTLDNSDNKDISKVLNGIMNDPELSQEEKEATFMYANDLVKLRGFNIGSVVAAANGYQEPPKVSSYRVRGNVVEEIDDNGNVLYSQEYENHDEAKAGLYEMQQQRFDKKLQSDIDVMKGRPDNQYAAMVEQYCQDAGFDPAEFEAALNKPSMERTEMEQQMVAPFAEVLHNAVYDDSMLHEEQSKEDGEEIADAEAIDLEGLAVAENVAGRQLAMDYGDKYLAYQDLQNSNEDLYTEVQTMMGQGMSPQEILSSLETFKPEETQIVIDYFNAKAKFDGYMNRMAQKIDEEAANQRESHTFKGTVNGRADLRNVYTITDGTNEYYLVSGNISTDPATGQITGSDSGLIIGMDLDGSFVQLSDTNGYSVMPSTQTLDQFEEQERIRLQEELSAKIDPSGALAPQPEPQQTEETTGAQPVAEAGSANGTGADETTAAPVSEEPQQVEIPIDEKTGVKLYEQGVPIDQTIADMQADGLDVNEEAGLAINEAQAELDKIKNPKTRAERVKNDARRKELENIIDYYNNVRARWAEMNKPAEQPVSEKKPSVSGLTVEEQKQERIKALKEELGDLFDDDFTKANDAHELVSMWLSRDRKLSRDSVGQELGWNMGVGKDARYVETMLAKKGEGVSINDFVHGVWESPENDVEGEKRFTTEEIKEALLDLFSSATSKSDVVDYAVNTREQQARASLAQQQQMEEEAALEQPIENQPIQDGGLPFAGETNEDFTNVVNENNNQSENKVSLQPNTEGNEQASMGSPNQEGDGSGGANATASDVLRGISIATSETGQGSRSKERLLAQLEESARDSGYWIEESVDEISDLKVNVGGENEVYKSEDGSVAIKLNNFGFLRDDATNFDDFINRLESFNELFPDVALQVIGFAKNSKGEVCVVLQQPWIEAEREATEEEIDSALEDMEFYTDITGNWTDGRYEVSDLKPNNVLVDKEGNLHFIDVVTFDETKPGQMMKAKKPVEQNPEQNKPAQSAQSDEYLNPRSPEEQAIIDDAVNRLQKEIDSATSDLAKARADLDKAKAKESERATDMFANDDTFAEPDAIFSQEEMGLDTSAEGVERRTRSEQEKVNELSNKLRRLLSPEERNSRIRGALDNYRRQTSIEDVEKQIDERHKQEYEQYIKPLLNRSDEELEQLAKRKEDAVGGDIKQLEGDLEYSAIKNVQLQREYDRQRKDIKIFIENTIDDEDVTFVDKLTLTEFDKLQSLINEYGVDDADGKIEAYVKQLRKKYSVEKKQSTPTANPIEAIEQAAQQFREEQKEKNYGADNKLVTQDRYEELKKRMKEKMRGQMNLGVDPEILAIGTEMAVYHIEAGARKFADYATRMIQDLGDGIRNYLKAFYEGARRLPEMSELSKEMDSVADVDAFDVLNYDKQPANTVNEHKQEDNEPNNSLSLQQETEESVERKAEDADKYRQFSQAVANDMLKAMETGEKPYKNIKDIRAKAKEVGLGVDDEGRTDILLQELVEDGLVSAARQYVNTYVLQQMLSGKNAAEVRQSRDLFNDIVKLYNLQPSITQRSSNRIKMQQYSTPLPMSFVADVFAYKDGMEDVLEPTAGNGMMVFAIPESTIHANELDDTRLDNLRAQKFKKVTDQDATKPFEGTEYDAIVANPPFGGAVAKEYDGKMIPGLAEQIALNALSKMKDNGRAAIIIGGNMEYAPNGAIKSDKAFFTYLYDHYNVKGVIDMDGKLYSKQGTTYPTRLILIDGRRSEEERAQVKVYPPVLKDSPMKVKTFEELFDVAEEIRNDNRKTNGNEVLRTSTGIALPDNGDTSGNIDRSGRSGQSRQNESDGRRTEREGSNGGSQTTSTKGTAQNNRRRTVGVQQPGIPGLFDTEENPSEPQPQTGTSEGRAGNVADSGRVQPEQLSGVGTSDSGVGLESHSPENPIETPKSDIQHAPTQPQKPKVVEEKRELETEKLSYRPHNTAFSLQSVAPAAMVEAMDSMLKKIEKEYGSIDAFVTRELGYDSIDDMHNALAAEQVDSVAMAIYQMKQGQGMIIGDQTGVGKGRQMAALIRWACRQGKKPVFITQKADLFSDIYRDLVDIGSGELRPFIFNSDGAMVDANGVTVHKPLSSTTQAKVFAGEELPAGYDFAVLTYSQVNTGDKISQDEAKTAAKESGERYQKKKKKNGEKATPKATFLRAIAKDNYLFLDESHTAAGKSNTGAYFQSILKAAKGVTFASATFAKRPDTMPMYAIRTAMSKAKVKAEELIKIIENGGVTLQEIMSRALTQAGQMVRRERDMSDVKTDWKTVDDPETVRKARDNYDKTIAAFNAIIDFQRNYVSGYLDSLSSQLAEVAASAGMRQGTEDLGIKNVPFASKTYNYTKQLMLALKVDAIVDEVVKEIEAGRHPVIALENTMGSLLSEYSPGDTITDTTFAASLLKGLKGVLRYTITNEDGKQIQQELTPEQLGPEAAEAYYKVENLIRESTSGIFISPLDAIIEKLQAKGYKVGELTGRNEQAVLDENTGDYVVRRRTDKDKKKLARDFNSGALDVLILNKSASTGISLHASEKFTDQRQRTMIIAQPLADINDYMQMIGRIDRTGQVARGYYINLGLPVPAEGRFLMMLSTKLKSLNANTTTSQESESNDVEAPDLLNKYGSKVVVEYLRDNPDIYVKMGEPLKKDKTKVSVRELDEYEAQDDDARKITGYVALLPTSEQDAFYNDVVRRYTELIQYLNDTGSNDLKISVLPLRARTIDKQVSSDGADPTGANPFAQDAYVEWVEMDVLKKPMKAAEIGKVIEQLNPDVENAPKVEARTAAQERALADKLTPRVRQIIDTVERETQAKLDKENERYEAAKARAEEDIASKTEAINAKDKLTVYQKQEAIDKYIADRRQAVEESHNNMVNKIDANHDRLMKFLKMFGVGDSVLVPDDLATDTFLGSSPGIFCGFKAKDEGVTPSTTLAVFATLDGRRKIEVKLSDWGALTRINNMTMQNLDAAMNVTLSNWDSQIPAETRKKGFIMTGNILQAFADAGQDGRVPGQLVTYTDIDGEVHDGILMNQHWEPSQLKGSTVPIKNRMEEIKNLPNGDHVISADGQVVISRFYRYYTITVPKSKKLGAQYYENDRLLDLVDGRNFYPSRGQLQGDIPAEDIEKAVNVLNDLGVQMKSDTQVQFDTETEMGQAQASGRRFDEDIDKTESVKDRVLSEFISSSKGEAKGRRIPIGMLTKEGREYLENLSGIKMKPNVSFILNASDLRHIYNEHYGENEKDTGNNIPLTDEDIRSLVDVIANPDRVIFGTDKKDGRKVFYFLKDSGNGTYNLAEVYSDKHGNLTAKTFYKTKKGSNLRADELLNSPTLSTSMTSGASLSSSANVPKLFETSKDLEEFNTSDTQKTEHQSRIAEHIDKLVEKLGTKARTTVYHSLEEVPEDVRRHIEQRHRQGKKVRGWYENGQIFLFLPDIDSEYQAEKTIWHETVAHHGLRELIGAENYDKLLRQLWLEHRDGEMGQWVTERMTKNGWNLNEAIDEYLAREAEKNPFKEPGLWQRLRWMLADILHKIGFATAPTISDIQYLFWVSQNKLRENDPMSVIKQQAFLRNLERQAANTPYVNMNAATPEDIDNPDAEGAYDDGTRYSQEADEEVIERLEKEPKVKVYRAMSLIDGNLYPPMATKQDGSLVNPIELGKWEKSDEHPEKAVKRNGKWVFKLTKDNGKSLFAAYNPYIHTSTTMLNDQFSEAQNRPNLVVVEVEVPQSELTSGYKAEKAKDAVGKLEWKAGVIQGQLTGTREVILSRWDKPVRIVPTEEVAKSISEQIKGKVEVMPTNVVTPQQRVELEKLGVKFVETDNQGKIIEGENKGKTYSSVYGKNKGRRFDEDIEDPMESAKREYDKRLNRIETVFTEAYQDSMVSLKTAQNAIAHDKDIPDSQNAYMAENLMHGKNKNEMDLFNRMFREPLINTINKIMNLTGMNWGDIDRYVYTKSGLERNREFFVRDWLEAERNKTIHRYEDLNDAEQDIYMRIENGIITQFEDGDITEEQRDKKLAQAPQEAHNRYVNEVESEYQRLKSVKYQELKDGLITFPEYLEEVDRFIRWEIDGSYKPEKYDYSGFRAMFGDEDGKYNEADIIDELMNTEGMINAEDEAFGESTTDILWNQINEATQYGLERYREAGMRSDEQIDRVESMFHWYVPMRGFKAETGEDMYQYFTGKAKAKSYVGGLLKHAKGRGSEANYPISTIFAMTYKAISDCNQNLVNQKFYRLCQANPNDLVILSDSWAVYDDVEGVWKEVAPDIPEEATEDEVREITLAWEEDMKELAKDGKAKKIKGKEQFDYKPMDKRNQSEHIVDVRINGRPRKMIVTGNPRMAQALNGQLRFEHGKNVFSRWNASIKNFMASVFTSYSPTFALRNMFRDWTHFRTMLGVREGHGYASQANKYYRQSLFKMVGLFKKYREGTLGDSQMEQDFKDFMDNGGITGFVFMQKIDDIQKEMESIYKKQKQGKTIRLNNNLWEKILGAVEALNEGIENNARFATYRTSRHYAGRTKARSAYDAKEITVNFNRKGAGGKTAGFKAHDATFPKMAIEDAAKTFGVTSQILGEGRIFFNATVQAIATTFKNFQNPDGSLNGKYIAKWAAKYALPPFMFGLALPMINKTLAAAFGGDDDDPYANLPEWTRRRNLCFYIGNNNFITIPIGQELAAFLTLGDIFAGNTYAPDLKPVDRNFGDEMVGVMNTFSPVDISTKITKGGLMEDPISESVGRTFSVLAPLVAVEQNLGWTGRPIYREDVYPTDKYNPEYQMVYQSTNPVMVGASKLANDLSGGDDVVRGKIQVNPAIVQYLWEQYTGGPGKVFSNTISIGKDAKDILTGNESDFNVRKVEGLKAFVQQGDDRTAYYRTQAKYRKYLDDAKKLKDAVNGYQKAADTDPLAPAKLEKISASKDFVRMQMVLEAEKSLSKINKAANKAEGKERKELRKVYNDQMKQVVDMLDQVGK